MASHGIVWHHYSRVASNTSCMPSYDIGEWHRTSFQLGSVLCMWLREALCCVHIDERCTTLHCRKMCEVYKLF